MNPEGIQGLSSTEGASSCCFGRRAEGGVGWAVGVASMSTAEQQEDHHQDCGEGEQEGRLEEIVEL